MLGLKLWVARVFTVVGYIKAPWRHTPLLTPSSATPFLTFACVSRLARPSLPNLPPPPGSLDGDSDDVGTGLVGAPACGDVMKLQVQIEDGIIVDTKFKTFGCGSGERREKRSGEERRGAGTYGVPCSVYVRAVYVHAVFVRKENTRRLIGNLTFLVHLYPHPFSSFPSFPLSPSISLCSLALPYFLFSSSNSVHLFPQRSRRAPSRPSGSAARPSTRCSRLRTRTSLPTSSCPR